MGVTMLPRFAAMVSSTTVSVRCFICAPRISRSVKGTRVMSATSLVATIASRKQPVTSTIARDRSVRTRRVTALASWSKAPMCRKPATMAIREKSISSVVVSMPCRVCIPGGTSRKDARAATSATVSTTSCLK